MDKKARPNNIDRTSQIDPNFRLRPSEKWLPIVFGTIGTTIFVGLIVVGVFGSDYYLPRGQKKQEATFFEEKIKDDVTYGLLIFMSAFMGFMRAIFDDIVGPQWSRLVNLHNTRGDAKTLAEAYPNEGMMWAMILGARIWTKTSDALMIYFSFTDLYIFMAGFVGNTLGALLIFYRFFDSLLGEDDEQNLKTERRRDAVLGETVAAAAGISNSTPGKLIF